MANLYMRFPGGKKKAFTLSYDDAVEQDTGCGQPLVKAVAQGKAWRAEGRHHVHGTHRGNQDGHDDGGGSHAQHAVLHAVPHNQHDDGQRPQKGGGDAHDRQVHRHQRHDDSNSHQKAAFRS